jgi:hypothetical protein
LNVGLTVGEAVGCGDAGTFGVGAGVGCAVGFGVAVGAPRLTDASIGLGVGVAFAVGAAVGVASTRWADDAGTGLPDATLRVDGFALHAQRSAATKTVAVDSLNMKVLYVMPRFSTTQIVPETPTEPDKKI